MVFKVSVMLCFLRRPSAVTHRPLYNTSRTIKAPDGDASLDQCRFRQSIGTASLSSRGASWYSSWPSASSSSCRADITPISAKVAGYLRELPIQDYQRRGSASDSGFDGRVSGKK